jgi:hypothetical protein
MSSLSLTKFFNDEGVPSLSPGWQKEVFVEFFCFETVDPFCCVFNLYFLGSKLSKKL